MELLIASVCTGLLAIGTLLPLSRSEAWWIRACDFPRLQLAIFGLLLMALQLWMLDRRQTETWILLAVCAACIAYHAWWIWPYSILHRREVRNAVSGDAENRVRIMVANVLMDNRNAAGLRSIVAEADPDILITVEMNAWWEQQLRPLEDGYPYSLKCALENKYGMHLYSQMPLEDTQLRFLIEPGVPSMHAVVMLRSGQKIRLHCVHPTPPSPTENDTSEERDAELIMVGREAAEESLPVIVTGDLNDVGWSATTRLFRKISRMLDPRIGRGMFNTYHAGYLFLRWPLDHLFHSRHFTLARMQRLPRFGSDHFPILVELVLEPERGRTQQGLQADAEDQAWADEKAAAPGH